MLRIRTCRLFSVKCNIILFKPESIPYSDLREDFIELIKIYSNKDGTMILVTPDKVKDHMPACS